MLEGNLVKEYVWEVFETSLIKETGRDTIYTSYGREVGWG